MVTAHLGFKETGWGRPRLILTSKWMDPLWAVLFALTCGAVLLIVTGHDPVLAYREWVERAILRPSGIQETFVRAIPLLFTGMAVLLALRAGVWNIGIDGQVLVGALAAAVTASSLVDMSAVVMWAGAAVAALLAGATWASIPALLRGRLGINEIITGIMFNYIAMSMTSWLVKGPLGDPAVVLPQTKLIPVEMRLSTLGGTRVHIGLLLAVALVGCLGWFLTRTVAGYELRATGASPAAAAHGQIPVAGYIIAALVASGAIAALAGANDVLSTKGAFQGEWNPAYGFVAFALVFLGQRSVVGLVPAALVFGQLSYAADVMPRAADVAPAFFGVIEGALLVALAVTVWARSTSVGRSGFGRGVKA
ncbi:MAG TPA: ABC transporter permease [Thermomicrobiales bacterium]|nr:ABC transporter permease [Thermomicrobiales bacterium]